MSLIKRTCFVPHSFFPPNKRPRPYTQIVLHVINRGLDFWYTETKAQIPLAARAGIYKYKTIWMEVNCRRIMGTCGLKIISKYLFQITYTDTNRWV